MYFFLQKDKEVKLKARSVEVQVEHSEQVIMFLFRKQNNINIVNNSYLVIGARSAAANSRLDLLCQVSFISRKTYSLDPYLPLYSPFSCTYKSHSCRARKQVQESPLKDELKQGTVVTTQRLPLTPVNNSSSSGSGGTGSGSTSSGGERKVSKRK